MTDTGRPPLLSIALTTYDRVELLIETLSSILAQSFRDFEVIVGNDNPNRTVNAALLGIHDERVRFVNHATNLGELGNMNALLNMARGRYFTWIADDDLYVLDALEQVAAALEQHGRPTCAFTSFYVLKGQSLVDTTTYSGAVRLLSGAEFLRLYFRREIATMATMAFYQTQYLRGLGGLEDVSRDGKGYYCEYMLLLKTSRQPAVVYIDAPLMHFRFHEDSWSSAQADLAQQTRAARTVAREAFARFADDDAAPDFDQNATGFLRWVLGESTIIARRAGHSTVGAVWTVVRRSHELIDVLRGTRFYRRAQNRLLGAGTWLLVTFGKQTALAITPKPALRLGYAIRAALFQRPVRATIASGK